jgi:membrane protein
VKINTGQVVDTGKRLFKETSTDDLTGLSAEMAYRLLLAMFPFFIFLAALGGFVAGSVGLDNPTQKIMDEIGTALPSDARSVLRGQLEAVLESKDAGLLSFGILGAIWGASAAMNTVIKALNRAYDVEETRPFWKKTPMALGLTLLAAVFFLGSFSALIAGQFFAEEVGDLVGLEGTAATAFSFVRFPVVFVLLTVAMAFIYWAAPNIDIPFRWVSPGALLFIVSWTIFTVAFGFYVSNFGSYQSTYGTLGGVVVLLVWLYMSSFLMLLGAELNAVLHSKMEPESMQGAPVAEGHTGEVGAERQAAGSAPSGRHAGKATPDPVGKVGAATLALGGVLAGLAFRRGFAREHTGTPNRREPAASAPVEKEPARTGR